MISWCAPAAADGSREGRFGGRPFLAFLPSDEGGAEAADVAVVVFLHGAAHRGDTVEPLRADTALRLLVARTARRPDGPLGPTAVLAPLCATGTEWSKPPALAALSAWLGAALDARTSALRLDARCVFLTGPSMGGLGAWAWGAREPARFAAVVPLCGGGRPVFAPRLRATPCWFFHAADDAAIGVEETDALVEALRGAGNARVRYTRYERGAACAMGHGVKAVMMRGHDCWTAAFGETPELYAWLGQLAAARRADADAAASELRRWVRLPRRHSDDAVVARVRGLGDARDGAAEYVAAVINAPNRNGKTALMLAAQARADPPRVLAALLAAGADAEATTDRGHSALVFAVGRGRDGAVLALLDAGADPRCPRPSATAAGARAECRFAYRRYGIPAGALGLSRVGAQVYERLQAAARAAAAAEAGDGPGDDDRGWHDAESVEAHVSACPFCQRARARWECAHPRTAERAATADEEDDDDNADVPAGGAPSPAAREHTGPVCVADEAALRALVGELRRHPPAACERVYLVDVFALRAAAPDALSALARFVAARLRNRKAGPPRRPHVDDERLADELAQMDALGVVLAGDARRIRIFGF